MEATVNFIKERIKSIQPKIAIVLGSGLGELGDEAESRGGIVIPYAEIPKFEASTVKGHKGRMIFAEVNGRDCVFLQGRFHYYEGHTIQRVTYPIKVLNKLGVKTLILTNAAGGINTEFKPGDLMLITDHINLMFTNPLIGKNDDEEGARFPDMTEVYNKRLLDLAREEAKGLGIRLQEGIYLGSPGPSYETPAEVRMLRVMGADACGMSTVPEAIVANHAGMEIMGISCITNMAAGIENKKLSHAEVVETANIVKDNFKKLISNVIKKA